MEPMLTIEARNTRFPAFAILMPWRSDADAKRVNRYATYRQISAFLLQRCAELAEERVGLMSRAIKGFDGALRCRGMQFVVGETYTHDGTVSACSGGFHSIPDDAHPLAVFQFYPPAGSRFCVVANDGRSDREGDKIASEILTLQREIGLHDLAQEAVAWVMARAKPEGEAATGDRGAASATGDRGAASATGYRGAASATGDRGAASATGYQGAASATGDQGAASATGYRGAASATGYQGAASATGDQGAASATGYRGAASATGDRGAASATGYRGAASATGDRGAASATGYRGAASATGDRGAAFATGDQGAASATGTQGRVFGAHGCALFAVERDVSGEILSVACGIAGCDGIPADTWLRCADGALVAAE